MTIVAPNVYPFSSQIRKKIGHDGEKNPPEFWGIYQQRHCKAGQKTIKMKFYKPRNPKTPAQMAQREKMRLAVPAWRNLTSEEKRVYNLRAGSKNMSGYNLFLKQFLLSV
jgi:hypothetical protein